MASSKVLLSANTAEERQLIKAIRKIRMVGTSYTSLKRTTSTSNCRRRSPLLLVLYQTLAPTPGLRVQSPQTHGQAVSPPLANAPKTADAGYRRPPPPASHY